MGTRHADDSVEVLPTRYARCLDKGQTTEIQDIEQLLRAQDQPPDGQFRLPDRGLLLLSAARGW
ncbi:hypothetical protein QQM39_10395 [Streptomyces sp. DT2A-34]|uniref:hypothetical protein n=1 Tax=Streptomyces sp. DT2A-34 TaxID=3051182 RepID=UPI00265C637A|nr:hypothetical protein [Streptomyces sp. DT2A-34]MDO0911250.1 hypothetical protein [Streptomyces sp. DT2A-34]